MLSVVNLYIYFDILLLVLLPFNSHILGEPLSVSSYSSSTYSEDNLYDLWNSYDQHAHQI